MVGGLSLRSVTRSRRSNQSRRDGRIARLCWEDRTLQVVYNSGDRNGAIFRVLQKLARRIDNRGVFVSAEARVMGQAQKDAMAAGSYGRPDGPTAGLVVGRLAGGYGRPDGPTARQVAGRAAGGAAGSTANPDSQYYAMVCSHCQGRHWFATVYTSRQVKCPQCGKQTPFNELVEGVTRSGPLGTSGEGGRAAGQNFANTCNVEAAAAAAAEDVEVELSHEMGALASPSKPPAPKKHKKGGEGGSSSQAVELTETQE